MDPKIGRTTKTKRNALILLSVMLAAPAFSQQDKAFEALLDQAIKTTDAQFAGTIAGFREIPAGVIPASAGPKAAHRISAAPFVSGSTWSRDEALELFWRTVDRRSPYLSMKDFVPLGTWIRVGHVGPEGPGAINMAGLEVEGRRGKLVLRQGENPFQGSQVYADLQGEVAGAPFKPGDPPDQRVLGLRASSWICTQVAAGYLLCIDSDAIYSFGGEIDAYKLVPAAPAGS